jgi:hypothetical protein
VASRCVAECLAAHGAHVSQLLASFIVRSIALSDPVRFDLSHPLSPSDFLELTKLTVERVLTPDAPALETMKLQVLFHSVYSTEERKLIRNKLKRDEQLEAALNNIIDLSGKLKNEQQVTNLYRHIFQYLLVNGYVDAVDRTVEREIAAALESIFPKFGLKAFCDMSVDDRKKQLRELVHIVLGIRLFNRAVGKGGAGFSDGMRRNTRHRLHYYPLFSPQFWFVSHTPFRLISPSISFFIVLNSPSPHQHGTFSSPVFKSVGGEVNSACDSLAEETQAAYDDTLRYAEVINLEFRQAGSIAAAWPRLQEELAHRRQYMAYLRQLQAESLDVAHMIEQTRVTFDEQMGLFKTMIGDRPSVPKEEVYPRFQMFARLWIAVS